MSPTVGAAKPAPELDLVPLDRPDSLAERAYRALREKVVTGALTPGQRLTERALAVLLGVSATPVREAIRRLEQEGLLTRPTPRSLTVVDHSEQTLRELLAAEVTLRALLARFATEKITEAQIDRMDQLVDDMLARAAAATAEQMLTAATEFDDILRAAADSPAVESLVATAGVFSRSRRLQSITVMRDHQPSVGLQHLLAHREITQALRNRDATAAEDAVRRQLSAAYDLLLSDLDDR